MVTGLDSCSDPRGAHLPSKPLWLTVATRGKGGQGRLPCRKEGGKMAIPYAELQASSGIVLRTVVVTRV